MILQTTGLQSAISVTCSYCLNQTLSCMKLVSLSLKLKTQPLFIPIYILHKTRQGMGVQEATNDQSVSTGFLSKFSPPCFDGKSMKVELRHKKLQPQRWNDQSGTSHTAQDLSPNFWVNAFFLQTRQLLGDKSHLRSKRCSKFQVHERTFATKKIGHEAYINQFHT